MTYTIRCPHCRRDIVWGHGASKKYLRSPICYCQFCGKPFVDSNSMEWYATTTTKKVVFCCSANNRWIIGLLSLIGTFLATRGEIIPSISVYLVTKAVTCVFTYFIYERDLQDSKERCMNKDYTDLLVSCDYTTKEIIEKNLQKITRGSKQL